MAVKCSLLTLSCALDGELPTTSQAELESHLVSCERCKIGLQYLREETERIANLPRIHLPHGTIDALLQRTRVVEPALAARPGGAAHPTAPAEPDPTVAALADTALADPPAAGAPDPATGREPDAPEAASPFNVEVRGHPSQPPRHADVAAAEPDAGQGGAAAAEPSDGAVKDAAAEAPGAGVPGVAQTAGPMAPTPPPPPSAEHRRGAPPARGDGPPASRRAQLPSEPARPPAAPAPAGGPVTDRPAAPSADDQVAAETAAAAEPSERAGPPPQRPGRRTSPASAPRRAPRSRPAVLDRTAARIAATAAVALAVVLLGLHLAQPAPHRAATGPSATPTPAHPRATAPASSPTAVPSPTAASSPTSVPSPTVPAGTGALPALTGTTTLGGSAFGYTVQTARYGQHPDGLWVVFQLVGGRGAPRATVGFAGATTLDVELQGVRPGTAVPAPQPGLVVTRVDAGGTATTALYTLHLTRAVQVSSSYLPGSLTGPSGERLILILH